MTVYYVIDDLKHDKTKPHRFNIYTHILMHKVNLLLCPARVANVWLLLQVSTSLLYLYQMLGPFFFGSRQRRASLGCACD